MSKIIVIGAGAFGTAMAQVVSEKVEEVLLFLRDESLAEQISKGENSKYLKGRSLSEKIIPFTDWEKLIKRLNGNPRIVIFALPTGSITPFFIENENVKNDLSTFLEKYIPLICLSKGIHVDSLALPDDILLHFFPQSRDQLVFLSGPSFASEIMEKQITMVGLAGRSLPVLRDCAQLVRTPYFFCQPTYDIKGLLLGGALKNVIAIAGGILEGLGHNHNTRAALITEGIYEMLRFGSIFNARPETFYGPSGMGDLILTMSGGPSRNKLFGKKLAEGKSIKEALSEVKGIVEGFQTTKATKILSDQYEIHAPIFQALYRILFEDQPPETVIEHLISSPFSFNNLG